MSEKRFLILAVLLVAAFAVMAGCTGSKTAKSGDNVSVDYIVMYENGTIFDTSIASVAQSAGIYAPEERSNGYTPSYFVIGSEGILKGFNDAVIGMKVGETKNVTLQPADAYGNYDPAGIQPANMSEVQSYLSEVYGTNETPYVNQTFLLYSIYGVQQVRVDSIQINATDYNNSQVYIDYNDPMAGKVLKFSITLRTVETPKATPTPTPAP
jgi:FKBP-type peptidyl-prolyl cis-trans isomerase 2